MIFDNDIFNEFEEEAEFQDDLFLIEAFAFQRTKFYIAMGKRDFMGTVEQAKKALTKSQENLF